MIEGLTPQMLSAYSRLAINLPKGFEIAGVNATSREGGICVTFGYQGEMNAIGMEPPYDVERAVGQIEDWRQTVFG